MQSCKDAKMQRKQIMFKSYYSNRFGKSRGQTIIEVIVALTLITLFLSGIVVVELYAIKNANYARDKSLATRLARQQLERARVVRDTAGIGGLNNCLFTCYINNLLTPIPVTPTGIYGQSLILQAVSIGDCPLPAITITPIPTSYLATASVNWGKGSVNITPAPEVVISSCLTDWR